VFLPGGWTLAAWSWHVAGTTFEVLRSPFQPSRPSAKLASCKRWLRRCWRPHGQVCQRTPRLVRAITMSTPRHMDGTAEGGEIEGRDFAAPVVERPPAIIPSMCGSAVPAIELPSTNCPGCGVSLDLQRLRRNAYVCECDHHFPLHGDAWIALLADADSWWELWTELESYDVLGWSRPRPYSTMLREASQRGLNEAVRSGRCTIGGQPCWLAVFDFRFMGGTLGMVAGERLARTLEAAADDRLPVVVVTASGGARMQEGALALMQMAKVNAALTMLDAARSPYFSVLTNPTFGGTAASLALLADVNLAELGASVGFTGRRVIQQATQADLPHDFQTADFQLNHGQVDLVVHRWELRAKLYRLLRLFS
jgi:acetyl-CoA carboxylase carboxyl transferase beta subunit